MITAIIMIISKYIYVLYTDTLYMCVCVCGCVCAFDGDRVDEQ